MSKWTSPTKRRKKLRLNCERKVGHATLADATAAMKETLANGNQLSDGYVYEAYQCPVCGLYHWGRLAKLTVGQ